MRGWQELQYKVDLKPQKIAHTLLPHVSSFQVVPDAVSYWESVLKVRPNDATIRLHRKCENNQYFLADDDPTQFCKNQCVETKCGEFK